MTYKLAEGKGLAEDGQGGGSDGIWPEPVAYAARVNPRRRAVVELATGTVLTYAELDDRIARAAAWLRRRIPGPAVGARVAFVGRNSLLLVALALACQRAGAVFVPVNWRLSAAEIAVLLADCTPALVVVDPEFAALAPGLPTPEATAEMAALVPAAEPVRLAADAPVTLLYTSGTTGTPKGVVVTARNALFAALNFAFVGEVGASSVVLSDLPMFHTIGLVAVMRTTLMLGATLVVSERFVPERTLTALADPGLGVTHYFAVPVMAEALLRQPGFTGAHLPALRAVFLGGSVLAPALIGRLLQAGLVPVNGYGMSEAGTALHAPIDVETIRAGAGAVGYPAPFIEARLVGPAGDVAAGEVGELWLRGPSVTPGYWNRPEETAAALAAGWYRTGDLARREPDGQYRIVDRLKDMYVSGGENVYPAEIEAVLAAHPDVADAAVLGIADPRWGETGLAIVVARPGSTPDPEALRAFCAERLARYKCPSRVVVAAAIPRSPAGKILKRVLAQHLEELQ